MDGWSDNDGIIVTVTIITIMKWWCDDANCMYYYGDNIHQVVED